MLSYAKKLPRQRKLYMSLPRIPSWWKALLLASGISSGLSSWDWNKHIPIITIPRTLLYNLLQPGIFRAMSHWYIQWNIKQNTSWNNSRKQDLSKQLLSSSPFWYWFWFDSFRQTVSMPYWEHTLALFLCMQAVFYVLNNTIYYVLV